MSAQVVRLPGGVADVRRVRAGDDVSDLRPGDVVQVDVDAVDEGSNVRHALPGMEQLEASVRHSGVLLPVLVVSTLTGLVLVDGHRRLAAARRAGRPSVPARVVSQMDADELRMTQMELNENARGLSAGERAEQLVLLASVPGARGRLKALGASREEVQQARAVQASKGSAALRLALDEGALDLETAARAAALADDPDWGGSVEELMSSISRGGSPAYYLETAAHEAAQARAVREEVERLQAEGHQAMAWDQMTERFPGWLDMWAPISHLAGAQGSMSPQEHAGCEHRVLVVQRGFLGGGGAVAAEWCMDPRDAGHRLLGARSDDERLTDAQRQEMAEELQQALEEHAELVRHQTALAAATEVRRRWVRQWLRGPAPLPAAAWRWAVGMLPECPSVLGRPRALLSAAQELVTASTWRRWSRSSRHADRLIIALACASAERCLTDSAGPYLETLQATGYELSEVEQEEVARWYAVRPSTADETDDADGDGGEAA